jgi:hypothetical protein
MTQRRWTPTEDKQLRALYGTQPASAIARELGRTLASVKNHIRELGLTAGHNNGRFPKGLTPWNKGKKYDSGGRSHETRFKPGGKPHTWKPIGSERVSEEGYLQRKMTDTGYPPRDWVPVHHILWREAGREIPPGYRLAFKDGNKRNFDLENLELVSIADMMRRNTVHNYGPEIAQLHQLRGAITRQINRRTAQEDEHA